MSSLQFLRLLNKLRHWGTILKASDPVPHITFPPHRLLLPSAPPPPQAGIKHMVKAMETESHSFLVTE